MNINEVEWLVSKRSVAELEDRLHHSERVEWARQLETVPRTTKFEKLKNFLVGRKKILENLETMGCRHVSRTSVDIVPGLVTVRMSVLARKRHLAFYQLEGDSHSKDLGDVQYARLWIIGKMSVLRGTLLGTLKLVVGGGL